ncbi:hypothetical protein [Halobacillus sp. K22]
MTKEQQQIYEELLYDFEKQLGRKLKQEEQDLLHWIAEKQAMESKDST